MGMVVMVRYQVLLLVVVGKRTLKTSRFEPWSLRIMALSIVTDAERGFPRGVRDPGLSIQQIVTSESANNGFNCCPRRWRDESIESECYSFLMTFSPAGSKRRMENST